jgi:hypothetical protein
MTMETRQLVIAAHALFGLVWVGFGALAGLQGNYIPMFANVAVGCGIAVVGVVLARRFA